MKPSILLILLSLLLLSCTTTKNDYLNNFDGFMSEVKEEHPSYTDADWEEQNEVLQHMLEDQYPEFEAEMTREEKVKIWSQTFSFQVLQHKDRVIQEITENQEVYVEMMKENSEFVEAVGNEFSREILPELEKALPEFERAAENFLQELENSGTLDRLKDAAKEFGEKVQELEEEHRK
jgi:ribosomal protein L16 Arg81 hydroxylase